MIKYISYLVPITKTIESQFNGTLEITWINGKKHLNTKNTNYSYGSLQQILKTGLKKIDISNCNSILLLGLGGGSVIETLRQDFKFYGPITAIDIDPVMIEIAKTEYGLNQDDKVKIICNNAIQWIEHDENRYDLIIVDIFVDTAVPKDVLSIEFWEGLLKRVSGSGAILFNAELNFDKNPKLTLLIDFLKSNVKNLELLEKIKSTNTLIIGSNY